MSEWMGDPLGLFRCITLFVGFHTCMSKTGVQSLRASLMRALCPAEPYIISFIIFIGPIIYLSLFHCLLYIL